ncbi:MAG: aminodeoxychorismate/anthranilate synthase component II [Chloroflexi bacterium]|nr:aminodeoxychorismate/anthranilate synthase component II [Chloroflexota bacterium]
MILVIDNYDSFTYNLVQMLGQLGAELVVRRNDQIQLAELAELRPAALVISPGPGYPRDAGVSLEMLRRHAGIPTLGVCLGNQCIGEAFGAQIVHARELMHGKTSQIWHGGHPLFAGVSSPFVATRYHSLMVEEASLPAELVVIARSEDGTIMGLAHRERPILGTQFHPESFLTEAGSRLLQNFLAGAAEVRQMGDAALYRVDKCNII